MRGNNICYHGEIRKLSLNYPQCHLLSGALAMVGQGPIVLTVGTGGRWGIGAPVVQWVNC